MKHRGVDKAAGIAGIILFFLCVVYYFFRYNRYHLFYLEQTQLFTYDPLSLAGYFTAPGGFARLAGAFVTQFFVAPLPASLLISTLLFFVYLLNALVFRMAGFRGILFPMLPVVILAGLHSNHNYLPANTIAWILVLLFLVLYNRLNRTGHRITFGIAGWIILYLMAGFYALIGLLILPFALAPAGKKEIIRTLLTGILLAAVIPLLCGRFFLLPMADLWLSPAGKLLQGELKWHLWILFLYMPLLLGMMHIPAISRLLKPSGRKAWLAGTLVLAAAVSFMVRVSYDFRNEVFLHIDYAVQQEKWNEVLIQSRLYPGTNRLVMYCTNLALYKTGRLADEFFNYPQSGTQGLWLSWQRNETAPFFGGEVFYELGNNNEAFRWAFEAMEAKGPNPRCLKRLAITSLVNGDNELAAKYLHFLEETLMYRQWAQQHKEYISDPFLAVGNEMLQSRRKLLVHTDFVSDISESDAGLVNLLENHPNNRMAFEYHMLTLLLYKDLPAFSFHIGEMDELGYTRIPRLFEEAILLYAGLNREFQLPQGFVISEETRDRFRRYAKVFAANRQSLSNAEAALRHDFGNTFWYYMQFNDSQKKGTREAL